MGLAVAELLAGLGRIVRTWLEAMAEPPAA
jgi:hypothetical protein